MQYERIALSRYSMLWFFLVLAHCAIQVSLQAVTHTENTTAKDLVTSLLDGAHLPIGITTVINNTLQTCSGIPHQSTTICQVLGRTSNIARHYASVEASMISSNLPNGTQVTLSPQCINSLSWIEEVYAFRSTLIRRI
jgi:hypothetical protein